METVVLTNGQYNTELGEGFMIGGYPSSSTTARCHAYNGTIGEVKVFKGPITDIQSLTGLDIYIEYGPIQTLYHTIDKVNDRHSDYISKLLPTVKRNSVIKYDNSTKLLDYDTTIDYSIQQTYTLMSHFSIDTSIYMDDDVLNEHTGIIYQVQTATKQIVLYRNPANFGGLSKFGTENIGKLGAGASMVWTDISYWAVDEFDNTIIVASFHSTYYSYIKITFNGTFVTDSGKYEYTAASGQNNGVAPSTYTYTITISIRL